MNNINRLLILSIVLLVAGGCKKTGPAQTSPGKPLRIVVMDPLAAKLACACVEGYAQRDYDKLGDYLGSCAVV